MPWGRVDHGSSSVTAVPRRLFVLIPRTCCMLCALWRPPQVCGRVVKLDLQENTIGGMGAEAIGHAMRYERVCVCVCVCECVCVCVFVCVRASRPRDQEQMLSKAK